MSKIAAANLLGGNLWQNLRGRWPRGEL